MDHKPFRQFIEALKDSVLSLKRKVCYIASADLSHMANNLEIGKEYGSIISGF